MPEPLRPASPPARAELGRCTWTELAAGPRPLLALAVGSLEQHGPHLPLDTDTRIGDCLVRALADRCTGVVAGPSVPYGASGEHAGFPGTVSVGHQALQAFLVELVRSAADSFSGVVLVSAHGGNARALTAVARLCLEERRPVLVWPVRTAGGDAHAGRTETSLMLALHPGSVRMAEARPGRREPLDELLPALRAGGVRSVSPNGVLGDPSGANADEGRRMFEELAARLVDDVDRWAATLDPRVGTERGEAASSGGSR